jgi:hypothetical protein
MTTGRRHELKYGPKRRATGAISEMRLLCRETDWLRHVPLIANGRLHRTCALGYPIGIFWGAPLVARQREPTGGGDLEELRVMQKPAGLRSAGFALSRGLGRVSAIRSCVAI